MKKLKKLIKELFRPTWEKLTRTVYVDAYAQGTHHAYRQAHRDLYAVLVEKKAEVVSIRESAKNKTTRTGADGMILGYDVALSAIREQCKALGIKVIEPKADTQEPAF